MTTEQFDELTPEQQKAMRDLNERSGISWAEMLERSIPPTSMFPYVGITNFHGMFVGIEPDGYTHS